MRTKAVLVLFIMLFGLTALATAQESLSGMKSGDTQQLKPMIPDPGVPDTIRVNDAVATAGGKAVVEVHIYNDEELGGVELPFKWSSPDITLDSVSFVGGRLAYISNKPVSIDNANQRVLVGMFIMFESNVAAGQGLAFTLHFDVPAGTTDQVVTIDSTFFPPGSTPVFSDYGGQTFDVGVRPGQLTIGNPKPTIGFSPANFTFDATQDASNPANQYLTISNTGAGSLVWTLTNASTWLGLSPTSGTDAGSVTVSANIAGLTAATYYDTIVITDANASNNPQKVPVTLVVASPPKPTISLSPTTFSFAATQGGSDPMAKALTITNTGQATLNWTVTKSSTWLGLSPTSGAGNASVTVNATVGSLVAGVYVDTIVVSDPNATNSPQRAIVTFTVAEPPKPTILLSPTSFTFNATEGGANPAIKTLAIVNPGQGTLVWTATKSSTWLTLTKMSATGNTVDTLSVDIAGLTAGIYVDTIVVSDPNATNNPQQAIVTLVLAAAPKPTIALAPSSFTFDAIIDSVTPPSQTLTITNTGAETLNWTVSKAAAWLTLDPTSGSGDGSVTVSVDITGLTAGTYTDTIIVTDPEATNSPQRTPVNLIIVEAAKPSIFLSPANFTFNAVAGAGVLDTQVLHISSVETGILHWTATNIDPWLNLYPTSGTGDGAVTLTVNATGLTAGTYVDTIRVSDPNAGNSPQSAVVVLVVSAAPEPIISVTPELLEFTAFLGGSNPSAKTFTISNAGTGELNWYLGATEDWLLPTPTSGTDNATVTVDIDITGLTAGVYIDTIFIYDDNAANSPQYVAIGLAITEETPPCFSFPVDTINFVAVLGESIPSIILPVTNPCGGTLTWTATWDSTWLVITPTGGTQDEMVKFEIDTTDIGVGTYYEIVTFESNDANSPFELVVQLELTSGGGVPWLLLSDSLFDFGDVCYGDTVIGAFDVINGGDGTLPWTAGATSPIYLSAHSGTAPSHVTFTLPSGLLPLGEQELIINVSSNADPEGIGTIVVKLNVIDCGGECGFDIAEVSGGVGLPVGVPIYAFNINDVAGLEFHIWYDTTVLQADSVTSNFMAGPDIGFADPMIHYVWDSLDGAFDVPYGETIMTLWFTVVGEVGQIGPIEWMGISEVVNPMAQVLNVTYCPGSVNAVPPVHTVSGRVVYYDLAKPVPDVTVEIQGPAQAATFTNGLGNYLFEDLYSGDYQVYAYRFNDDSGVTVADAVKMRRHLAQIELFDSPYKMIAGDVNVSSTVSIADVIVIRRYLAMLDTLPCGNWVFVDSGFAVTMNNWFIAPRDMRITIIDHDVALEPFIGIRMGDVNNTWGSPKGMFAKPAGGEYVSVGIGEVTALEGETVAIPVTLANASDMAGMEIHVGYDARVLTYTGISSETFQNMTLNGHDGAIHMVWEDINAPKQLNGEQTVITLNFQVTGNLPASTEISVTGAEVVNSQGDPYRLAVTNGYLYNGNGGSSSLPNTYSLAQNSPNPFNPTTTIRAAMADGGEFTLTVFNIMGEKVRQYRGWHAAGPLEITWDARNDDGAQVPSGIYLYRFQAGSFSQTRQMILLK